MDDSISPIKSRPRPITTFAGGCLALLYLALCVVLVLLGRIQMTRQSAPASTPTVTAVPHILVHPPSDPKSVVYDDFSSNKHEWGLYFDYGKLEVIHGKLIVQSYVTDGYGLGTSAQMSPSGKTYYVQASLSTDLDTDSAYGLIFGLNKSLMTYYMFELWPEAGGFRLLKYNAGKWIELIPFSTADVLAYPEANTLSVYFDRGSIELYINGKLVSNYSDNTSFQSSEVGVFASSTGYRLLVDDFFVYDEK